jgi:hypothetical protein
LVIDNFKAMSIENPGRFFNAADWDDDDEDKMQPAYIYGKELYKKAVDILNITTIITDLLPEEPDEMVNTTSLMMANAYKIPAKIRGAMVMDLYSLKMENAVIIKVNVMELKNQIWACEEMHGIETKYTDVLKKEIEAFKELFIQWIQAFDKSNDVPDDWHLFNDPGTFPEDDEPLDADNF